MNILHISPVVYLDRILRSFDLAHAQASMGHNVTIVGANDSRIVKKVNVNRRLRVYLLPSINFPYTQRVSSISYITGLPHFIKKIKPDIVHVQCHLNLTAVKSVITARDIPVPVVTTIHGVFSKINPLLDLAQLSYLYTIGGIIFKNSDRIICLTKRDSYDLERFGCPSEKISVVPNGVDINLFRPRKESEKITVMWHGRFVASKGLDILVKAASKVIQKSCLDIKFVLVGDGPLKQKIMVMCEKLGITKDVMFVDRLPLDEVAQLLSRASIYVLPSIKEGMPWALLEAMACGKAVVASDISGVNDIITHRENGLLVPPKNIDAFTDAIIRLAEDVNLRKRLGRNARQLIIKKYNWRIIAERLESIYRKVVNKK